jgi:branched-chain amino acid transport system permease protein
MIEASYATLRRPFSRGSAPLVGLGLILSLLPVFAHSTFLLDIFIMVFFYGYMALSWNLLGGKAGMFSLGHSGFFGIGAYASTLLYLQFNISPWIGMIASALLSGCAGLIFFYPCFRLQGIYFALATLGFAEVMLILFDHFSSITGGGMGQMIPFSSGLKNLIFETKGEYYYLFWAALLIAMGISYGVGRSKFGRRLEAVREDERVAQTLRVDVVRAKLAIMLLSAVLTAIGGTLYAQYVLFISPDYVFSAGFSFQFLLISIVGGVHTILGPVLGSFIITPLDVVARFMFSEYAGLSYTIYGGLLVLMAVFLPEGLLPLVERLFKTRESRLRHSSRLAAQTLESKVTPRCPMSMQVSKSALLKLEGVQKSFSGLQVLTDVSFTVREGEILGLIGPNGAGKTTLVNIISGFLQADKGRVWVGEKPTGRLNPTVISRMGVGRTFQIVRPFPKLTILENVVVGALFTAKDLSDARKGAMEILCDLNLAEYQDHRPENLPLEMRKRLELARALSIQPKLLLLDEVMSGLNPTEIDSFLEIIRRVASKGVTLFVIEHVIRVIASLCSRVIVLNHGEKISEGPVETVLNDEHVIQAYLGKQAYALKN